MQELLGTQAALFWEALDQAASISIRQNPQKKTPLSFLSDGSVPWCEEGLYLKERPVFTLDPLLHAGAYYVQEASSMFVSEALKQTTDLSQPLKVLDLCAAPGGKSTLLASLLSSDSLLVCNEMVRHRYSILNENLVKWGAANIFSTNYTPKDFAPLKGYFDIILVDAPCSGEGLFRKDPKAMNEWSPQLVDKCVKRQKDILSRAVPLLKEDGILLYSTCTYNRKENIDNASWLTKTYPLKSVALSIPEDWGITLIEGKQAFGYSFFPHLAKGEGFYLSIFQNQSSSKAEKLKIKTKSPSLTPLSKNQLPILSKWVNQPEAFRWYVGKNEVITAYPKQSISDYLLLNKLFPKNQAGLIAGTFKKHQFIPDHALALSTFLNNELPQIELEKDQALHFLKKEPFTLAEIPKGWSLIRYKNLPLGWIKGLGHRFNNYYPKEWKIRMSVKG